MAFSLALIRSWFCIGLAICVIGMALGILEAYAVGSILAAFVVLISLVLRAA